MKFWDNIDAFVRDPANRDETLIESPWPHYAMGVIMKWEHSRRPAYARGRRFAEREAVQAYWESNDRWQNIC
jgi:hypothetical protein